MVKKTSPNTKSEINKFDDQEILAKVSYAPKLNSSHASRQFDSQTNDDLILSLSDKPENRRARQVFEWEKIRRQAAMHAF